MWAYSAPADDAQRTSDNALRGLGVSQESLGQPSKAAPKRFELWAWHLQALNILQVLRTQWRVAAGVGGLLYIGLDYTVVDRILSGCSWLRIDTSHESAEEIFEQLRAMEVAAKDHLNGVKPDDDAADTT